MGLLRFVNTLLNGVEHVQLPYALHTLCMKFRVSGHRFTVLEILQIVLSVGNTFYQSLRC